jgi:hypothetical protein
MMADGARGFPAEAPSGLGYDLLRRSIADLCKTGNVGQKSAEIQVIAVRPSRTKTNPIAANE